MLRKKLFQSNQKNKLGQGTIEYLVISSNNSNH